MKSKIMQTLTLCVSLTSLTAHAQVITSEDSLVAGLRPENKATVISGYGEAAYRKDLHNNTANISLTRGVVFIGHKFSDRISFFSEIEIEDAKVAAGDNGDKGGEVSFEQAFLKFGLNRNTYIAAGLFVPRIGITNENHLPTTFNSVLRPVLETVLIPATWRELGASLYGSVDAVPGLNYTIGIVNGLNTAGIAGNTGVREARYEGRNASANNLAITGSLLYYWLHFRFQASGYYGGTVGLTKDSANSVNLDSGPFGTPFMLGEIDAQYSNKGFYAKALATITSLPDANKVSAAYHNNPAQQMQGFYVEAGYNLLETTRFSKKQLFVFSRYEKLDLNAKMPTGGIADGQFNQQHLFVGMAYKPTLGVIVKADYQLISTGAPNPQNPINTALYANPNVPAYVMQKGFVNLGIGYSF